MAVFYNKEKSKLGTLSGTIIHFPRQMPEDNDPALTLHKELLPAGYLRCDGSVLSKNLYPALAVILGVGSNSKFIKEGQTLTDNQFQLPDLRQKHIRATNSSDQGVYNDLYVTDANGNQQVKAGVGLEVIQNVPSPFEISYTGKFFLPSQTVELSSRPQFTRSSGGITFAADVQQNEIQPHMHYSTTYRQRQHSQGQSTTSYTSPQMNYERTRSSLVLCTWFEKTVQDLCYWASSARHDGSYGAPGPGNWLQGNWDYGGVCRNACGSFMSQGLCLWPSCSGTSTGDHQSEGGCPPGEVWSTDQTDGSARWRYHSGSNGDCNAGDGTAQQVGGSIPSYKCFGEIKYDAQFFQECNPAFLNIGSVNGSFHETSAPLSVNYTYATVPFANPGYYDGMSMGQASATNLTTRVGSMGDESTHVHQIPFEVEEHTYKVVTDAVDITANGTVESTITIRINESRKSDEFIQPYIISEYLIKT